MLYKFNTVGEKPKDDNKMCLNNSKLKNPINEFTLYVYSITDKQKHCLSVEPYKR